MRKFTFLIIFLSFLNLAMAPSPRWHTEIRGKVTDSKSNLGISEATIRIYNLFGKLKAKAQTDSSGSYALTLELPRAGVYYKVAASCRNYNSNSTRHFFLPKKAYRVDLSLSPKPNLTNHPPQITSITPTNGSIFLAGAKITVKVTASDPDKDLLQYRFFIGGSLKQAWSSANTYTWQTSASDTGVVDIAWEVRDIKGGQALRSISYSIIDPTAQDILKKVADNYAKIYDLKADMTLSSTLDGKPFGETEYCRYYFKAPNKEKTETFSNSYRTTKTDIIIINGSTMHLINPIDEIKQQVNLLTDAGITSSQFSQMDIYYNQANFLKSHTVTKNDSDTDFSKKIIALDAVPKQKNNLYSKLKLYIDYNKGLVIKLVQNKNNELPQIIETMQSIKMSNGAWVTAKIKKNPNFQAGNMLGFLNYDNIQINSGLSDLDFDPNKQY